MKLISVIRNCLSAEVLQHDLDLIKSWSDRWLMKLNESKTFVLLIPSSPFFDPPRLSLESELSHIDTVRDLGVYYDSKLKFNTHVARVPTKAKARFLKFRQIFKSRHKDVVLRYYLLNIRPVFEYAISVWWGVGDECRAKIERIQRKAPRMIVGYRATDYDDHLNRTKLVSIADRCFLYDIVIAFKSLSTPSVLSLPVTQRHTWLNHSLDCLIGNAFSHTELLMNGISYRYRSDKPQCRVVQEAGSKVSEESASNCLGNILFCFYLRLFAARIRSALVASYHI
eukprot:GHVN01089057.1.p1 GENE.GHVN01089057.1~~GHVN01089057.1.p1  ORF type:complete len:283 (-),score=23.09 GHVN01089057.1:74-922(-)